MKDEREEQLREHSSLGNLKAVMQLLQAGVNPNSQNSVNGMTALHWAVARDHERVARLLISHGAKQDIKNSKGKTPVDLARAPDIRKMFDLPEEVEVEEGKPVGFVPNYLANPDPLKAWSTPDEIAQSESKITLEPVQSASSVPSQPNSAIHTPMVQTPTTHSFVSQSPITQHSTPHLTQPKEVLVYFNSRMDVNLLGSLFLEPQETLQQVLIRAEDELDAPKNLKMARHNGTIAIPVSEKQAEKILVAQAFADPNTVLILLPKQP